MLSLFDFVIYVWADCATCNAPERFHQILQQSALKRGSEKRREQFQYQHPCIRKEKLDGLQHEFHITLEEGALKKF